MENSEKELLDCSIPSSYAKEICRLHKKNPYATLLGISIDGLAEGYCRLRLTAEKQCTNPYGGVHGGVFASLVDTAMGIALRTVGLQPVTAELTVNYLGQSRIGEELIAEGWVVHRGNTLILTEGTVKAGGDKIVTMAKGVFMSRGLLLGKEK